MKGTTGNIFNIQHFSIHDGPGIRSTIFFQGCPLHCLWCHNPESNDFYNFVGYNSQKCMACGSCAIVCSKGCHRMEEGFHVFNRKGCAACGACVETCYHGALQMIGRRVTVDEVVDEVCKDRRFFEFTGGGITLSGGEPAMQPDFAFELLTAFEKKRIHRAVETCGYIDRKVLEKLMPKTDLFLFDCKETDTVRHQKYTGVGNERILANLRYLHDNGANVLLRCPMIPGLNAGEEHLKALAQLVKTLPNLKSIELLPYHSLGVSKVKTMDLKEQREYEVPSDETVEGWNAYLRELGVDPIKR